MGGLTMPKQKVASNIFSLSGDIFDPLFDLTSLIPNYTQVLQRIRISSPANFAPIMRVISDYASYEADNYECRNFYHLIYLTPGIPDDFQQTFDELKYLHSLPI